MNTMKRRNFFKCVAAIAATAILPFKALAQEISPWQMVLNGDGFWTATCKDVVQSGPDTFVGEFLFNKSARIKLVFLQHKTQKTTTYPISFPPINVTSGDVLRINYRLVKP